MEEENLMPTIHYISQTTSTQQEARRLIAEERVSQGDLVVADEQTAGRGRFGRTWISPRGGLYVTVILAPDPLLPLKAGLAVVDVLRSEGIDAGLKWPNDVLVGDLKIAGVLIEIVGEYALVGIGLNLTSAPLNTSTCLARYGDRLDRDEWARRIASELLAMPQESMILDDYRKVCLTLGRSVRVEGLGDATPLDGVVLDVDEEGRLIVETQQGNRTVSSGECFHLRAPKSD